MADSTKNGGEQTRFETKHQTRVTDIAGKYQVPFVRETFFQIVDYGKRTAKDAAQYRHKKEGDELLKALEHDIDYGLQLTHAVDLAEKVCDTIDASDAERTRQKTARELEIKELEGTILQYGIDSKKLADEKKKLEMLYVGFNEQQAMLAPMAAGLENGRHEVYAAKRDFYELAMQVIEEFRKFVNENTVPVSAERKDLPARMKDAVEQLKPTAAELEFLARQQQTKPRITIREKS